MAYSYSKSLSLPGERIGYLVIPSEVADSCDVIAAAGVANRILGFVNAPTLLQKVVAKCIREKTDLTYYNRNRETLYEGLRQCGFSCIKPQGAFYLFVKSPIEDEKAFCEAAKEIQYPSCARKFFLGVQVMCGLLTAWHMRQLLVRCRDFRNLQSSYFSEISLEKHAKVRKRNKIFVNQKRKIEKREDLC